MDSYIDDKDIDLNEKAFAEINQIDFLALTLTTCLDGISKFKDSLKELKSNGIPPGVQFILFYYLGILINPHFENHTKAGHILKAILNNGNGEEFRK